jgi:hypothetical protein
VIGRVRGGVPAGLLAGTFLAALVVMSASTSVTESSWTVAAVNNTGDTGATGSLAFTHAGTTTCAAGPAVSSTTTCTGSVVPTSATPGSGAATGTDSITQNGTIPAARLAQTVQAPSCAPVQLANTKTASDPMLARYATAFQQTDKWGTSSAVGLSGSAYASDVTSTTTVSPNSEGVWFKVANGYSNGGGLISVGAGPASAASATSPIAVWMNNAGKISVYVMGQGGQTSTATTTGSYNDGGWHLVVLSVTSGHSSPVLYLDGVATVASVFNPSMLGATGFWHVGWLDTTGLAGAPTSATLTGTLSGAFATSSALTQANVTGLNGAPSAAAYSTAVLALGGEQHLWMLGDSGTTTYTGTLPSAMTAPCSQVDVAFSFTSPTASIAQQSLTAFANGTANTVAAPVPGNTQTMTVSLSRGASYDATVAGLHLYAPLTFTEKTAPTSAWALSFAWPGAAGVFLA